MSEFGQSKGALLEWVECFGGPADGETVPVDPADPIPYLPYQTIDQVLYWYCLQQHTDGRFRFFLKGYLPQPGWTPVPDHDTPLE